MSKDQDIPKHAGKYILEKINKIGMPQAALAERMGRPLKSINEIIKGKVRVTLDTALQLKRVLNIDVDEILKADIEYHKYQTLQKENEELSKHSEWVKQFPLSEMRKFSWIKKSRKGYENVREVLKFFGVATKEQWEKTYRDDNYKSVAFRISLARSPKAFNIATWIRHGDKAAENITAPQYDVELFKHYIDVLRSIACKQPKDYDKQIKSICLEAGVKVVLSPYLKNTGISGAARWIGNNPVIQMSDRYKSNGHFWFSFFHEVGHILLHGKKDIFIDSSSRKDDLQVVIDDSKEEEADNFSSNLLIPKKLFKSFLIQEDFSENAVRNFAKKIRIHEGIVAGRIQRELGRYNILNDLIIKLEIEADKI